MISKISRRKLHTLDNLFILFISVIILKFDGCCFYSFTGASVPPHLQTISIPIADDRSGSAESGLREMLTQKLIQKFIDDNSLQIVDRVNAHSILETSIISFTDIPAIVAAGENITSRRITIGIKASYRDLLKKNIVFDKVFTNYANYPSDGSIVERNKAIEEIIDKTAEDILLETVSGW